MPRDRLAASGDLGIQDRNHIEKSFCQSTRLSPSRGRVIWLRSIVVVVVLDDDVAMAAVHRAVVRTLDDDGVGAMMPAPMTAIAVVIESFSAVLTMMKALAILIDDDGWLVVVAMLVCGNDDRISGSNRRRGQEKRHRAQNQGGFHNQYSENLRCPSPPKHRTQGFCSCVER